MLALPRGKCSHVHCKRIVQCIDLAPVLSARSKPASLERSIASYFDKDGFLVEPPFRADVLRTLRAFESQQKKVQ